MAAPQNRAPDAILKAGLGITQASAEKAARQGRTHAMVDLIDYESRIHRELQSCETSATAEEKLLRLQWAQSNIETTLALAKRLNAESGNYLPPLAVAILADDLTDLEKARLGLAGARIHPAGIGVDELRAYFEALGREVFR